MTKQEAMRKALELRKEFESNGYYLSWINADIYPNGKIYTQEYTEWLENQLLNLRESKNPIDFNKLRDEFFAECTNLSERYLSGGEYEQFPTISLAPHDMFEWLKKKLTTKL